VGYAGDRMIGSSWHASRDRVLVGSLYRGLLLRTNGEAPELHTAPLATLLTKGLIELSPDDMAALIGGCKRRCEQGGEARYCLLHEMFEGVDGWRSEHDEHGGVPVALVKDISARIALKMPAILSQPLPDVAARLASELRDEIFSRLLPTQEWN
jgi:hypothetical protein